MSGNNSRKRHLNSERNVSRRDVLRIALAAGAPLVLLPLAGCSKSGAVLDDIVAPGLMRDAAESGPGPLIAPVVNAVSTELCANSRLSYHGGWSSAFSDQWLSNILWAAGKAPTTAGPVVIYIATSKNVYTYDPVQHALNLHLAGNHRGDSNAAFQLGFAGATAFDAGVAQHLAQQASVALWTGTSNQVGSCPRETDTTYANSNWNPASTIHTGISFGTRNVAGLNATLQAVSSDGSLPNPSTDGLVYFDDAIAALKYGNEFSTTPLTLQQQSQLLWGAYGCTAHTTSNGRAGLTVASAVANYYLTGDIYILSQFGVHRYHNRLPPGNGLTTRDHRLELVSSTDIRQSLQQSISNLPSAPVYIVLSLESSQASSRWALLEAGFAASSMLVQGTSMGLRSHFRTGFIESELTTIRNITGIPTSDVPITIVSVGSPKSIDLDLTVVPDEDDIKISRATGGSFGYTVHVTNNLNQPADVKGWVAVKRPNGLWYGPVIPPSHYIGTPYPFHFNPNQKFHIHLMQNIPPWLPLGAVFKYYVRLGQYVDLQNDIIEAEDWFTFRIVE